MPNCFGTSPTLLLRSTELVSKRCMIDSIGDKIGPVMDMQMRFVRFVRFLREMHHWPRKRDLGAPQATAGGQLLLEGATKAGERPCQPGIVRLQGRQMVTAMQAMGPANGLGC